MLVGGLWTGVIPCTNRIRCLGASQRDLDVKRLEYARAGIADYWIVDPEQHSISMLVLEGDTYRVAGEFRAGQSAVSQLLAGFTVDVQAAFAAGEAAE